MVISTSINGLADQTADLLAKWNFQKNKDSEEVFEKPVLKKKHLFHSFWGAIIEIEVPTKKKEQLIAALEPK